ncbi:MAG: hypothetical protein AAFY48_02910 [Bacteroidota bacterium]
MKQLFLSLLVFGFSLSMLAQVSGPLPAGARGQAMALGGTVFQDIHAAWGNPAGIAYIDGTSVALFGEQRFALSDLRQISAAGAFAMGNSALGLSVGYFGFDAYNESRIGLVYGRKLARNLALGAQVFTLGTRIPDYGSRQLVSFELGLQATISPSVRVGGRITNPMRVEILEDEPLPTSLSFGFSYQPGKQVELMAEIEKDILFPVRVRTGLEYQLMDVLQLRAGVATSPSMLSFGIGYKLLDQWLLDFAASYHQFLGFTPGIGLVYAPKS